MVFSLRTATHDRVEFAESRNEGAVVGHELFAIPILVDCVSHVTRTIESFCVGEPDIWIVGILNRYRAEQFEQRIVHLAATRHLGELLGDNSPIGTKRVDLL